MFFKSLLSVGFFTSLAAHAYHVSKLNGPIVDFDRNTRVIAVGYSGGMGDLFVKSASARARRYLQIFPQDQILLIRNKENANDMGAWDTYLGFEVYETGSARLSGQRLVHFLTKFKPGVLKSLDVFSHSAPGAGMALERGIRSEFFSASTPDVAQLKEIFAPGAFANIHGCNGGYLQAPTLSELWEIPVSGALSGSDFQRLNSNGDWYFNNSGQYPTDTPWATKNLLSFTSPLSWMRGSIRMKAQNSPYRGVWGVLMDGLPFNKFFCNYDMATEESCSKSMAESLLGFISQKNISAETSLEDYKEVVQDYLCPISSTDPAIRQACVDALVASETNADLTYASFRYGNEADCDMSSCKLTLHCEDSKCKTGDEFGNPLPKNKNPRTIIDEYRRYLAGYDLIY